MNKKKWIILSCILVLVGYLLYYFIPRTKVDRAFDSESIDMIPSDAFAIIKSNEPFDVAKNLFNSPIGKAFFSFKDARELQKNIASLDSFFLKHPNINEVLKNKNLLLSFHKTGLSSKGFLFVTKINNDDNSDIKKIISDAKFTKDITFKEYDEELIYSITLKNNTKLHIVQFGNCLAMCNSLILAETVVRHYKHGQSLGKMQGFEKLYRSSDELADVNVFINFNKVGDYLFNLENPYLGIVQNKVNQFGNWMELDVKLQEDKILMNGFTYVGDSTQGYLNSFLNTTPQKINAISTILPSNTSFFTYQGFGDFNLFYSNFEKYLSETKNLYAHQRNIEVFNQRYKLDIKKDFFSWIGNDVCAFVTEGNQDNVMQNYAVAIHIKDIEMADASLQKILNATKGKKEVLNYLNYSISDLNVPAFLPTILGDFYMGLNKSYYTILEDYIVFANDISNLKNIIYSYLSTKTLVKNVHFNKFTDNLSSTSSYLLYINCKKISNFYSYFLHPDWAKQFNTVNAKIKELDGLAIQFVSNSNLYYTNVFVNKMDIKENEAVSLIECSLDASYSQKPWVVINHTNNEKELMVQDHKNTLYLINNVGKIIWKKSLKNQIVGDIHQVDCYKNNKLQYLFGTGKELHLIDRNGDDVSGFPVKLKNEQTCGIAVLDYDKNRNYRILIPTQNKILNFGIEGKEIGGWEFKPTSHKIVTIPQLMQLNNKDYIVFADLGGNVRVLNRKGEDRVKLQSSLPKNRSNYEVIINSNIQNSGVLTTDENGTVFMVKLNDELETITIRAFSANHQFYVSNINNDKGKDIVFLDEGNIYAYKLSKKAITEIKNIDFTPDFGVQFFHANNKVIYTLTNAKNKKVFAYNIEGNLYDNFPIEGATPCIIVDLDNDNRYELIVGDALGSLYFYKIF